MHTRVHVRQLSPGEMAERGYTIGAINLIMFIRSLSDTSVLAAARRPACGTATRIAEQSSTYTNPNWISAACAKEAYDRGLIDERELDHLTD